ncbi:MAG: hypothetical protein J6A49_09925 [Clostridia bacterium]|nr:hypothetical protein [Clostridia bacterium]
MATSSFNDKVVITDPDVVEEMKEILDNPDVKMMEKDKLPNYTIEQAKENARKWTPDKDLERILAPIEIRTEEQLDRFLEACDKARGNIGKYTGNNVHILTPEEIREKFKDRLKDKGKKNKE